MQSTEQVKALQYAFEKRAFGLTQIPKGNNRFRDPRKRGIARGSRYSVSRYHLDFINVGTRFLACVTPSDCNRIYACTRPDKVIRLFKLGAII